MPEPLPELHNRRRRQSYPAAWTIYPIAGVIIAVAGISGLSPFDIIRRTLIPMLSGWLIMLAITFARSGQIMELLPFLAGAIVLAAITSVVMKKRTTQQLATQV